MKLFAPVVAAAFLLASAPAHAQPAGLPGTANAHAVDKYATALENRAKAEERRGNAAQAALLNRTAAQLRAEAEAKSEAYRELARQKRETARANGEGSSRKP